jgi:hypothetical protein
MTTSTRNDETPVADRREKKRRNAALAAAYKKGLGEIVERIAKAQAAVKILEQWKFPHE